MKCHLLISLLFLSITKGYSQTNPPTNHFTDTQDTLILNSIKISSLYISIYPFRYYPDNLQEITKEIVEKSENHIGLLSGTMNHQQVFILDQNTNRDFRDDSIRLFQKMNRYTSDNLIACKYRIIKGGEIITDSSWVKIGTIEDRLYGGSIQHQVASFTIANREYYTSSINIIPNTQSKIIIIPGIFFINNTAIKNRSPIKTIENSDPVIPLIPIKEEQIMVSNGSPILINIFFFNRLVYGFSWPSQGIFKFSIVNQEKRLQMVILVYPVYGVVPC